MSARQRRRWYGNDHTIDHEPSSSSHNNGGGPYGRTQHHADDKGGNQDIRYHSGIAQWEKARNDQLHTSRPPLRVVSYRDDAPYSSKEVHATSDNKSSSHSGKHVDPHTASHGPANNKAQHEPPQPAKTAATTTAPAAAETPGGPSEVEKLIKMELQKMKERQEGGTTASHVVLPGIVIAGKNPATGQVVQPPTAPQTSTQQQQQQTQQQQ
eukprot:PhF_6_TR25685/c0_g1_i2/m.36201